MFELRDKWELQQLEMSYKKIINPHSGETLVLIDNGKPYLDVFPENGNAGAFAAEGFWEALHQFPERQKEALLTYENPERAVFNEAISSAKPRVAFSQEDNEVLKREFSPIRSKSPHQSSRQWLYLLEGLCLITFLLALYVTMSLI